MQYFFSILSEKKGSSFIWDSHYIYILSIPLAIIIGPVYEEFIFRYYISDRLFLNTRKYIAMIVSSLLFSVFHSPTNISSFVVYFIFGIIQGLLYKKTKNIYAPIVSHCMVNAVILVCN
ncbi:CPBP family intramembrane glutamic endopeptidase [Leuconostoc suionicum]|uniref:CPBP family intramembrane glutamic endopeptidase n=1 Tax=Leuconostoc suionicum TaxID=1511761 RepID=UPI003A8EA952